MSLPWQTRLTPEGIDGIAPDGSQFRLLARARRGSMACFTLPPGAVARAVCHRTVEELWYVLGGAGRLWRARDGAEEVVALVPGLSLSIPPGAAFQFRAGASQPLTVLIVTIPPWPGDTEAEIVPGPWTTGFKVQRSKFKVPRRAARRLDR